MRILEDKKYSKKKGQMTAQQKTNEKPMSLRCFSFISREQQICTAALRTPPLFTVTITVRHYCSWPKLLQFTFSTRSKCFFFFYRSWCNKWSRVTCFHVSPGHPPLSVGNNVLKANVQLQQTETLQLSEQRWLSSGSLLCPSIRGQTVMQSLETQSTAASSEQTDATKYQGEDATHMPQHKSIKRVDNDTKIRACSRVTPLQLQNKGFSYKIMKVDQQGLEYDLMFLCITVVLNLVKQRYCIRWKALTYCKTSNCRPITYSF